MKNIITSIYEVIVKCKENKAKSLKKNAEKAIEAGKVKEAKAQKEIANLQKKSKKIQKKIEKLQQKNSKVQQKVKNIQSEIAKENEAIQKAKEAANVAYLKAKISAENLNIYKELTVIEKAIAIGLNLMELLTGNEYEKAYIKSKLEKNSQGKAEKKAEAKAEAKVEAKAEEKTEGKAEKKAEVKAENKPVQGINGGKKGFYFTNKKGEKKFYEAVYAKKLGKYGAYIGSTFYEFKGAA